MEINFGLFPSFVCPLLCDKYTALLCTMLFSLTFNFGVCAILWEKLIWTFKLVYENGGVAGPWERVSLVCFYLIGDLMS